MTSQELLKYFNETYGMDKQWPRQFIVNHETYANVCRTIFSSIEKDDKIRVYKGMSVIEIVLGPNNGIMFKNVELILK